MDGTVWDGMGTDWRMAWCAFFSFGEKWDGIGILVTPGTVCASLAGADDLGRGVLRRGEVAQRELGLLILRF